MILALITSPLSFSGFAFAQEESIGLSDTLETELVHADEEEEVELKGKLTDNKDGTFDLETEDGTETISTDENTVIDDGLSLSDLDGLEVEVEAVLIDGVLFATEIEFEEEEEVEERSFGDKITICHIPPGNPSKAHTITVGSENAVNKHLAHGDVMDSCNGQVFSATLGESKFAGKQAEREAKLAEKESRLAGKQMELEAKLAEKESKALQRAVDLIQRLEQRITDLEQRLQTLLNKVESGEYYGNISQTDPVTNSYSISIDGMASSLFDESVTTDVSGEIFIENLRTDSKVTKFKVTGGEIFVGDEIYDVVFGKARISSSGPSEEKDSMVLILQSMDSEGNGNTIRLSLDFESALEGDFGIEPIELKIIKSSKISGQWSLSASGQLSLLQV